PRHRTRAEGPSLPNHARLGHRRCRRCYPRPDGKSNTRSCKTLSCGCGHLCNRGPSTPPQTIHAFIFGSQRSEHHKARDHPKKMYIDMSIFSEKHVSRGGSATVATNPAATVDYGTPTAPFGISFPRQKNP